MVEKLLDAGGNFIRNGSGALMLAYVAAGRLVGYYEPYMHAWDCMAGYCLVKEAGGCCLPFPVKGEDLTKGAPVLAAAPGAVHDLAAIAGVPDTAPGRARRAIRATPHGRGRCRRLSRIIDRLSRESRRHNKGCGDDGGRLRARPRRTAGRRVRSKANGCLAHEQPGDGKAQRQGEQGADGR